MTDWLRSTAQTVSSFNLWKEQNTPAPDPMHCVREYARTAILPDMPLPHKSRRLHSLNSDLYRCQVVLRDIEYSDILDKTVTACETTSSCQSANLTLIRILMASVCDRYLHPGPLDYYLDVRKDDTEADFTVPAPGFDVPFWPLRGPTGSRRYA